MRVSKQCGASYNVFDFGKREHTIKERNAQVEMAEAALELAKTRLASGTKKAYMELVRSRQISDTVRQTESTIRTLAVKCDPDNPDLQESVAKLKIEMLQADLEHGEAYAKMRSLMASKTYGR